MGNFLAAGSAKSFEKGEKEQRKRAKVRLCVTGEGGSFQSHITNKLRAAQRKGKRGEAAGETRTAISYLTLSAVAIPAPKRPNPRHRPSFARSVKPKNKKKRKKVKKHPRTPRFLPPSPHTHATARASRHAIPTRAPSIALPRDDGDDDAHSLYIRKPPDSYGKGFESQNVTYRHSLTLRPVRPFLHSSTPPPPPPFRGSVNGWTDGRTESRKPFAWDSQSLPPSLELGARVQDGQPIDPRKTQLAWKLGAARFLDRLGWVPECRYFLFSRGNIFFSFFRGLKLGERDVPGFVHGVSNMPPLPPYEQEHFTQTPHGGKGLGCGFC